MKIVCDFSVFYLDRTLPNGKTVLEGTYSVGIFLGIVLFFNHFSHFQISDDPTPLEVQMRIYEKDVNTAIIENEERSEDGVDVE